MSFSRNYHPRGDTYRNDYWHPNRECLNANYWNHKNFVRNLKNFSGNSQEISEISKNSNLEYMNPDGAPSTKRRRHTSTTWGSSWNYLPASTYANSGFSCSNPVPHLSRQDADATTSTSCKRGRTYLEDDEVIFMSKDEIDRLSPSRKDGIDLFRETHLRYTYCTFLQNLGMRLELPQTTIGTAMVLCHRFFIRRSHASHDRFLIATAALFLTAKYEETARPLSDLLRASCEAFHKQDISLLSFLLPVDWFEQYRERVLEAEQLILTTLNFELNVQHPFAPLTSVLNKLGLSQTGLLSLALSLISEGICCFDWVLNPVVVQCMLVSDHLMWYYGHKKLTDADPLKFERIYCTKGELRSSLWLQFKPHQIAAGAAYLAARSLKLDLAPHHGIWHEFQVTPSVIQDVANQLMELF